MKYRKRTSWRGMKATVACAAAVAALTGTMSSVSAAPRLASQPGTARPAPAPAPVVTRVVAAPQVAQPVPQEIVRVVPGAPQIVSQPVIIRRVVENRIVYETSPGLALASPGGSAVLNPLNVAATWNRNIRPEDRVTWNVTAGASTAGAVVGGILGAGIGALGGAAAGGAGGAAASGAICGAIAAIPAIGVSAAACLAPIGPISIVSAVTGAAGAGLLAGPGSAAGTAVGARLGAAAVPGGQAVFDRITADTTWDLENQARLRNGAEGLRGAKPGDSMPVAKATPAGLRITPPPARPISDPAQAVRARFDAARQRARVDVNRGLRDAAAMLHVPPVQL